MFKHIQTISDTATAKITNELKSQLKEVEGFLEVQRKKEEIAAQLTEAIAKNKDMKMIIARCKELMRPSALTEINQDNDDNANED